MLKQRVVKGVICLSVGLFLGLSIFKAHLFSETEAQDEKKDLVKTKGSVSFGLALSQGNTEAFGLNANLNFSL